MREFRRVVTGHTSDGKSCVVFDGPGGRVGGTDQLRVNDLWVTDRMPASNIGNADDGDRELQLEPPRNGTIFRVAEFAPNAGDSPEEAAKAAAALFQNIQGTHSQFDTSRHPQMHRTASVDCIIILSGRITLILDEGEVELGPYDTLIQRGTNHAWVNKGPENVVLGAVLVYADPL